MTGKPPDLLTGLCLDAYLLSQAAAFVEMGVSGRAWESSVGICFDDPD
jgi:hypothetical protein